MGPKGVFLRLSFPAAFETSFFFSNLPRRNIIRRNEKEMKTPSKMMTCQSFKKKKNCLEDSSQWTRLSFKHLKCANHCIIFHHARKCLHFYFCGAWADEFLEKKLAPGHASEANVLRIQKVTSERFCYQLQIDVWCLPSHGNPGGLEIGIPI